MPTWTITQYFHQKIKAAGDSKRENLCQQDSDRVTSRTPGASTSGQLEAAGAPISVRPVATEDSSSGEKSHLHPSIDGENTSNFTLNDWTVCRFPAERFVWASSWLTKDHKDFKSMAMNKGFLGTQAIRASTSENIDRSQRRIHYANIAGVENISMVKEVRCWVIQQQHCSGWKFTRSHILHCVLESRNRNKIGGRKERTRVL